MERPGGAAWPWAAADLAAAGHRRRPDRPPAVDPLARLLAALIGEASLYIAQAPQPDRARREAGATIDRILTGLRPDAGS
jgi:uncharacterized protein (TIGR03382 family)